MIKRKLILTLLGSAASISLLASVSSTIAWYQYSVRSKAVYQGTTAHCSKLLQISCDRGQNWNTDLDMATIESNTNNGNEVKFAPITTGAMEKDAALPSDRERAGTPFIFYGSPAYRRESYDTWDVATSNMYARFSLDLKVVDINTELKNLTNDIYLTDLTISDKDSNKHISDAIRVHFAVTSTSDSGAISVKNYLFAKNMTEIAVGGPLDLNNDGKVDAIQGYDWEFDDDPPVCIYGEEGAKQTSYLVNDPNIIPVESNDMELTGGSPIGQSNLTPLKIDVTIWVEGWCELLKGNSQEHSSVWDAEEYVANQFNIGMTFGVKLHTENE